MTQGGRGRTAKQARTKPRAAPRRVARPAVDSPARRRASINALRRTRLLDQVVDYLLAHGIAGLKLRPAGAAAGTSARMLVHHFGSKENLLTEALAAAQARQIEVVTRDRDQPVSSFDGAFHASWTRLASNEFRQYLHLSYEVLALALRDRRRYRGFLGNFTEQWRVPFATALEGLGIDARTARDLSTVYSATLRGLLLDLMVTGDVARVQAAVVLVADRLKAELATLAPSA